MRILVIEDEVKIAQFIKRGLKEEGYAVDVSHDGEEGHFLLSSNEYDAIILDLMLPKIDGMTLCRNIFLCKRKLHPFRNAELLPHKIEARYKFSNRMFDL